MNRSSSTASTHVAQPHGFVTKSLHWLCAAMLAFGYLKGLEGISQLAHPGKLLTEVLFAATLGAAFAVRLIWVRSRGEPSRLPPEAPQWEHLASRAVHKGLYASVFLIVLSGFGIALGYVSTAPTSLLITIMIGLHEFALSAMPLLLLVHVAGALWHRFVRHDGVMESMTGRLPNLAIRNFTSKGN